MSKLSLVKMVVLRTVLPNFRTVSEMRFSLNFHPDTRLEMVDDYTLRMHFPEPDGLILGKFRGFHIPSTRFWDEEGFGYRKRGTGEGHW